jgi:Uma2 family endonuclease
MHPMADPARNPDRTWTYADYRTWPDTIRCELIDGVFYDMSPAANRFHQQVSWRIEEQIAAFLKYKPCRAYHAPFDVIFPDRPNEEEDEVRTVVQPDILVVCDRTKLTDKGCTGAPDWIIEILSPYTSKKDLNEKFNLYERHGVREYWIVDPGDKYVQVYLLNENRRYGEASIYLKNAAVPCRVLAGLSIGLASVFNDD